MANSRFNTFFNAISTLPIRTGLSYTRAIAKVRGLLAANDDAVDLKLSEFDVLARDASKETELKEFAKQMSYEDESAAGTYQAGEQGRRDKVRVSNILVRALYFDTDAAKEVYDSISGSASLTLRLDEFVTTKMTVILKDILKLTRTKNIQASQAHEEILQQMQLAGEEREDCTLARELLSKQMLAKIDEVRTNPVVALTLMQTFDKKVAEIKTIEKNRALRCAAASPCNSVKADAINDFHIMRILGIASSQTPLAKEKLEALEVSLVADEDACESFGFANMYLTGVEPKELTHNLGFFAQQYKIDKDLNTAELDSVANKGHLGIFDSTFNTLMTALQQCAEPQFISIAAMAMLMPVVNQTLQAITGAEMEYPRLGM